MSKDPTATAGSSAMAASASEMRVAASFTSAPRRTAISISSRTSSIRASAPPASWPSCIITLAMISLTSSVSPPSTFAWALCSRSSAPSSRSVISCVSAEASKAGADRTSSRRLLRLSASRLASFNSPLPAVSSISSRTDSVFDNTTPLVCRSSRSSLIEAR